MSTKTTNPPQINLEDVEQRFTTWRNTKPHRTAPIPRELWEAAVSLAATYPTHTISKRLRLDHTKLKKRVPADCTHLPEKKDPAAEFIELKIGAHETCHECVIAMKKRTGAEMKIQINDIRRIDFYGLCEAFWRNT